MSENAQPLDFNTSYLDGIPDFTQNDFAAADGNDYSWELIGLGLEEALPSQEVVDELY